MSAISYENGVFRLNTRSTSYWFRVTKFGHLEQLFYGERLEAEPTEPLTLKRTAMLGSSVMYDKSDDTYCLDVIPLEWSGVGKGDFRNTPAELKMPDGTFVTDFCYSSHKIVEGAVNMKTLPSAYADVSECETLEITLCEKANDVKLIMYYTVFPGCDVIIRRCVLINMCDSALQIRKLMSMSLDLPNRGYTMMTQDGGWIKETHRHDRKLQYGTLVNSSTTGASGNRHNPAFALWEENACEDYGRVYGFNLVYSGNHYSACELAGHDTVRVMTGINPYCFEWTLAAGESFETPEAVMTFSARGFNQMSHNFHDFVNNHIVRKEWKGKDRPVLLNNWEAHFFRFNRSSLLRLAKRAKKLGIELFVLDDGWFGARNSDKAGLGDYKVNTKKLPGGLKKLSEKITGMGMQFGLWFEPESVNEDSELFRTHPEYAIKIDSRTPSLGRNQLLLDLCNEEVREYIVKNVRATLESADISYVKWDMNRHMSEMHSRSLTNQGEFFHRYILGLYDILNRIFCDKRHILLETCASGGNRFDLGMLCFSPQIWASDDTDPIERLEIQRGLSYFYPQSAIGAHVSGSPHQQTLRATPLATRFHAACFGCLGYELDLKYLAPVEKKAVREQIKMYKEYRDVLQYGRFYRFDEPKKNKVFFSCVSADKSKALSAFFQTQASASEGFDFLPVKGLDENMKYTVRTREQGLRIKRFGALIHHILPVRINPEGAIVRIADRHYELPDCVENYEATGRLLMAGTQLNNQFVGSYYNKDTRLLGDFGSSMYIIEEKTEGKR
ncbi:MAG: alpha-galactosidase [Oscillospiraceae bacterium]